MEDSNFTTTEESTTRSEQCQCNVFIFYFFIYFILFLFLFIYFGGGGIECIVHKEFFPPGQTVNGKFYCNILRQLRDNIRRKRPDIWRDNSWTLHYDNAPAHVSLVV